MYILHFKDIGHCLKNNVRFLMPHSRLVQLKSVMEEKCFSPEFQKEKSHDGNRDIIDVKNWQ